MGRRRAADLIRVFFASEGLGVDWPAGDAALLYLVMVVGAVSQAQSHWLARAPRGTA